LWQPVDPPIKNFEYSSGYDIMSTIIEKYHSATILLPINLQKNLILVNNDLKYLYLLEDSKMFCLITTIDPKLVIYKFNQNNNINNKGLNEIKIMLDKHADYRKSLEDVIIIYNDRCINNKKKLIFEMELFLNQTEEKIKILKRKDRRHINTIRIDISTQLKNDELMMTYEDYHSSLIEKIILYEKVIGILYIQKLLYFCLFEEYLSRNNNQHNHNVNIIESMRKSLPYYNNLSIAGSFIHYFYIVYNKEKNNNKQVENNLLNRLSSQDRPLINYEVDQSINNDNSSSSSVTNNKVENNGEDNKQNEKIYTKADRKKEKRAPVFLYRKASLAGKTDASIEAEKISTAKALKDAIFNAARQEELKIHIEGDDDEDEDNDSSDDHDDKDDNLDFHHSMDEFNNGEFAFTSAVDSSYDLLSSSVELSSSSPSISFLPKLTENRSVTFHLPSSSSSSSSISSSSELSLPLIENKSVSFNLQRSSSSSMQPSPIQSSSIHPSPIQSSSIHPSPIQSSSSSSTHSSSSIQLSSSTQSSSIQSSSSSTQSSSTLSTHQSGTFLPPIVSTT